MDNIKNINRKYYIARLLGLQQSSSGSVPSMDFDFPITNIDIEQTIKSEIEKQLNPIKETQNALLDQFADMSVEHEAINDEINNLRKIYSENYQLKKKIRNITTILSFKNLQQNWNSNGAEPFSENLIQKTLNFINSSKLRFQPDVFPTARQSIQLEYEKSNGNYLEIEIFENKYSAYTEINDKETEYESLSFNEIMKLVDEFYSRI
jgi:hypothetical protein